MSKEILLNEKYQPIYFTDFEKDNDVINMLKTFISIDHLNILLIGDIGSGKSAILNAIIKEYYKDMHIKDYKENILYINNLKDQGINYYRNEVKIFCQTCSNIKSKKKFVVLDDIDLINEQSQQVFRNCIDKYSHKVHFIASCNNIQKVIESLQSRLTIMKITKLNKTQLLSIITKIKYLEHIDLDEGVDEFIIKISNNIVKNIINYMEKFKILNEKITLDIAVNLCTNINFMFFEKYSLFVLEKKLQDAIKMIYIIYNNGYSVMDILDNYFEFIKVTEIFNETQKYNIIPYICKYISTFHNLHENEIELALFTNNIINILNIQ